jgi:hypothetical protein
MSTTSSSAASRLRVREVEQEQAGEIPTHKVGTHTRFRLEDVRAFDRMLRKRSRAAFDELRALEHSLGLYEDD